MPPTSILVIESIPSSSPPTCDDEVNLEGEEAKAV
jgi:hypothetical protein